MSYMKSIREGLLGRAFAMIDAASAVSAAVDAGRRPHGRHLKVLGIEASAFDNIRRR